VVDCELRRLSASGKQTSPGTDRARNAGKMDPMDPREFEKKTQDELDDILNRCVLVCIITR